MDSNNESGSFEYEHKLFSLKILNEALKFGLISHEQYTGKQNEFLRSINFDVDEADEEVNSIHAAELMRENTSYEPQEKTIRKRMPSSKMRYADDYPELQSQRKKRPKKPRLSPTTNEEEDESEENVYTGAMGEEGVGGEPQQRVVKAKMMMMVPYEEGRERVVGKHKTFSEFIFAALRHLGGEAELQELYQYVFENRDDIDPRFSYRFKTGDYKSNVRSTLHNTGSFHKNNNGKWTIDAPLKGRKS